MNPLSDADYLRHTSLICEPDPRTTNFVKRDVQTGAIHHIGLADQHAAIARFKLNPASPDAIKVHFETAKNLYLYAWFVYRFYPIAEQQALASLEFALREHLSEFVERYKEKHRNSQEPGLGALLKHAIQNQVIRNEAFTCRDRWALERAKERYDHETMQEMINSGLEEIITDDSAVQPSEEDLNYDWLGTFLECLPNIRNDYAHGSPTLRPSVLRTFEVVMEIINQLYQEEKSPSAGTQGNIQ